MIRTSPNLLVITLAAFGLSIEVAVRTPSSADSEESADSSRQQQVTNPNREPQRPHRIAPAVDTGCRSEGSAA